MALDGDSVGSHAKPVSELRALVLAVHDRGVSYEDMARAARAKFPNASKQYFQSVARGQIVRPKRAGLALLAAGLPGVTETQVKDAAARSGGVYTERNINYETSQLLAVVEELDAPMRHLWVRMAGALASELSRDVANGSDATAYVTFGGTPPGQHSERVVQTDLDTMKDEVQDANRKNPSTGE